VAFRVALSVVVAVIQVGGTYGASHAQPDRRPMDALAVGLLLVAPVALLAIRRWTVAAVGAIGAAVLTFVTLGYAYGPVFLGLALGVASAVVRGHRVAAWAVALAVVVGDAAGRLLLDTAPWSWAAQGAMVAWMLVVLSVAEALRAGRERAAGYRAAAREARRRQAGEERLRIAQELHDVVAHHMSLISVQAGVALHLADRRPENVEPALRAIKDASREALTELRSLIDLLRDEESPAPRAPAPTLASIDDIVERSGHAGLQVTKTIEGQTYPLPTAVELAAYRIVQEAITNVVRHAHATRADITLGYGAQVLTVAVADDGRGADDPVPGTGLRGMQERAEALGGTFAVERDTGGGLRVVAALPVRSAS
jgi:signal transduction histidine kinase